jgi:glycosyltransferase involved in cell wall biosynthesis
LGRPSADPEVSVVMAAYNAAEYVAESIESVLAQTYTNFELLVVDDASVDATADIVRSIADPRVRLLSLPTNSGAAAARNLALRSARAELIAILDADDIAYPKRLERQVAYMNDHPGCALLGSAFDRIDASGALRDTVHSPCDPVLIRWHLLKKNVIAHSSVIFRRSAALAVGGYREDATGKTTPCGPPWLRTPKWLSSQMY